MYNKKITQFFDTYWQLIANRKNKAARKKIIGANHATDY